MINQEFARRVFESPAKAMGKYFKRPDGTRLQVVGIVENGKYASLTEDPRPAMFLPFLQSPSSQTYLAVRSGRDPAQLAASLRELRPACPGRLSPAIRRTTVRRGHREHCWRIGPRHQVRAGRASSWAAFSLTLWTLCQAAWYAVLFCLARRCLAPKTYCALVQPRP